MTNLQIGDTAPSFTLPDSTGALVSLNSFAGRKLIVYFYPAALTAGCTTQAVDFSAAQDDFEDAGYSIVGISPDTPEKLAQFIATSSLSVTLLADPTKATIEAWGAWGERVLYGKAITSVIRSTFVVDVSEAGVGTIVDTYYNIRATGHVRRLRDQLGV
ncbi:MAG: peroxiredoxin [Propionibacteriaceae bacterium]|jgi:peroxiredoxin Q/BCP|nr:peroxiredoxin [Propionibacteriaceae bacterium]